VETGYPDFMKPEHFQEFMDEYCAHFGLNEHIVLGATVRSATRNQDDTKWRLDILREKQGTSETLEFDKVVFCHGYQTKANVPVFEGQDKFAGTIMHSQQYRT